MSRPEATIYRSDHIVGLTDGELTQELYQSWGRTLGRLAGAGTRIALGSDVRESSALFKAALKAGFNDVGVDVDDLGDVPHLATLYSALRLRADGIAYVSGLGWPSPYNGLCWGLNNSPFSHLEQSQILKEEAEKGSVPPILEKPGVSRDVNLLFEWVAWHQAIWFDTPKVPFRIILDPLHGTWAGLLRRSLQMIFPYMVFEAIHDSPDPGFGGLVPFCRNVASIERICSEVDIRRADMGFVLDGDTGCFTVIDDHGVPLSSWELSWLMLQSYASAVHGESVVYTSTFPAMFLTEIRRLGGHPIQTPISHAGFVKTMQETNSVLGFDHCGRFFSRSCEGHYITFFAICWLIDYLARLQTSLSDYRQTIPPCFATLELATPWQEPEEVIERLAGKWNVTSETTLDGWRFSGPNGRANVREVRDFAELHFQFEAKNRLMLDQMVGECVSALDGMGIGSALWDAYQSDPASKRFHSIEA